MSVSDIRQIPNNLSRYTHTWFEMLTKLVGWNKHRYLPDTENDFAWNRYLCVWCLKQARSACCLRPPEAFAYTRYNLRVVFSVCISFNYTIMSFPVEGIQSVMSCRSPRLLTQHALRGYSYPTRPVYISFLYLEKTFDLICSSTKHITKKPYTGLKCSTKIRKVRFKV